MSTPLKSMRQKLANTSQPVKGKIYIVDNRLITLCTKPAQKPPPRRWRHKTSMLECRPHLPVTLIRQHTRELAQQCQSP
ncbi:hypothetical protein EMIT0162MI3_10376 [Pseudomonas chlororaphis]